VEYKTIIILSVVLYGCETWFLTLRALRMLRRLFGQNRDEMMGGWRKLHNEELRNLYSSPNIIKEDEIGRVCRTSGGGEK
jgi:hypothetical protein